MKKIFTAIVVLLTALVLTSDSSTAMDKGHDSHDPDSSDPMGELFHESMKGGYMLSYYLMDLRDQNTDDKASEHMSHGKKQMDKPHHIMVYIMDKDHKPVIKGKVGFLIKADDGTTQKVMGMYMSQGFGITADMKKKGRYAITTKAVLGNDKLMDKFTHEMK